MNPWADKLQKAGKVKVTIRSGDEIVEQYWIEFGSE